MKKEEKRTVFEEIFIKTEYIKLGQFLKFIGAISVGSDVKDFLDKEQVLVDGISEKRRGRKLYKDNLVSINGLIYKISKKD